jgi:hypothetical protein
MTATLTSNVIGCEVKLTTPNNLQAIFLAETLLAALEALLATSLNERVYPYRSTLEIRMRPALFDIGEPTITAEVASRGAVEITHPRDLRLASVDARNAFKSSVLRAIAVVMFQIAAIPDAETYLDRLSPSLCRTILVVCISEPPQSRGGPDAVRKPTTTLPDRMAEAALFLFLDFCPFRRSGTESSSDSPLEGTGFELPVRGPRWRYCSPRRRLRNRWFSDSLCCTKMDSTRLRTPARRPCSYGPSASTPR